MDKSDNKLHIGKLLTEQGDYVLNKIEKVPAEASETTKERSDADLKGE